MTADNKGSTAALRPRLRPTLGTMTCSTPFIRLAETLSCGWW